MSGKVERFVWIGLVAVGGLMVAVALTPFAVVPRGERAPSFIMADAWGQPLWSQELRGHITLFHFTYTRCGTACAPQTAALQALQQRTAGMVNGIPVTLVSVSFDPAHDSEAVLHAYAQQIGADPQHWRVASGPPDVLKSIIGDGFKVYYQKEADNTFIFDSLFVLVDDQGYTRARYRTATLDVERVMRDIDAVAEEMQHRTGARGYAYEAAHLFVCAAP